MLGLNYVLRHPYVWVIFGKASYLINVAGKKGLFIITSGLEWSLYVAGGG